MGIETIIIATVSVISLAAAAVSFVMMSQSKKTSNSLTQFNITQCSEGLTIPRVYGTCVLSANIDFYKFYYDKAKYNHSHVRVPVVSCRQIVASNPVIFLDILENNKKVGFPKYNSYYRYGSIWGYSGRGIPSIFRTCGSRWGRTGQNEWPHSDFKFKRISWLYFAYFVLDYGMSTFPNYQIKCRGDFSGILPTFGYNYSSDVGENPLVIIYDCLNSCGEVVDDENFYDVTQLCNDLKLGLNIVINEQKNIIEIIKSIQDKTQIYFVKMGEKWRAIPFFQTYPISCFLDYRYLSNFSFFKVDNSIYNFVVSYGRCGESVKTKQFNYSNINGEFFNIDFSGYKEIPANVLNYIITNKMYTQSKLEFDVAFDYFKSITVGDVIEFENPKLGIGKDQYKVIEKNIDFENFLYHVVCVSISPINQIYDNENGGEYNNTEPIEMSPTNITEFYYYEYRDCFFIFPVLSDIENQNFLAYYTYLNGSQYDELNEYGLKGYLIRNIDFLRNFDPENSIYAYFDKKTIQQFSFENSVNYYDVFKLNQCLKIGNEIIKFGYVTILDDTVIFSNLFRDDPVSHGINDDVVVFSIEEANLIKKENFLYQNQVQFLQYNENETYDENQATQFTFFLSKIYLIDKIFFYFKKLNNIAYFRFFIYDWENGAGVNEIENQLSNFSPIFLGGDSFISINNTKYTTNEINYTISVNIVNIVYYKDSQNFINKNFDFSAMDEGFYDFG